MVITKDLHSGLISWRISPTFREIAYAEPMPQVIAIDIPIGLPDHGPRECDREARHLLRPRRASSVFPAPIRPILSAVSCADACRLRRQIEGKGISLQTWGIIPKVREVDDAIRQDPALELRVREVHPEVCFCFLAGGKAPGRSKKTKSGQKERRKLLEPVFGRWLRDALDALGNLSCAQDDLLDAFVALWTAERIASGKAHTIPASPPQDLFGLCMKIVV